MFGLMEIIFNEVAMSSKEKEKCRGGILGEFKYN